MVVVFYDGEDTLLNTQFPTIVGDSFLPNIKTVLNLESWFEYYCNKMLLFSAFFFREEAIPVISICLPNLAGTDKVIDRPIQHFALKTSHTR